jgi:hypothetical protein
LFKPVKPWALTTTYIQETDEIQTREKVVSKEFSMAKIATGVLYNTHGSGHSRTDDTSIKSLKKILNVALEKR